MIEIASPATPQASSFLPPRRRRSPNDARNKIKQQRHEEQRIQELIKFRR
jgi:hypothetical protein